MTRSSPSVDRVASLLTYLASHPNDSFSVAELGRRLDISKATCHALVASLSDWGFVLRNPTDKQIRLGPALLGLGVMAAAGKSQLVDFASEEMRFLAAKYDCQCAATVAVGDEIVVLSTFGNPGSAATSLQTGQRLPLRPPFGGVHIAWAPTEVQDHWLANQSIDVAAYQKIFAVMRERGFSVALEIDPRRQVNAALRGFRGDETIETVSATLDGLLESLEFEEYYVMQIAEDAEYRIRHIAAPVFGASGDIPFVITLTSLTHAVTGHGINAMADDVVAATKRVTKVIARQLTDS
jgi:DNA-binding IclR family transcriptional regulator